MKRRIGNAFKSAIKQINKEREEKYDFQNNQADGLRRKDGQAEKLQLTRQSNELGDSREMVRAQRGHEVA